MIASKQELAFYIKADRILAGYKPTLRNMFYPSLILTYLKCMRCCSFYKRQKGILNRMKYIYYFTRYTKLGVKLGFSIGYDTFGYGLLIPHYGTIVVNVDCKAGNYCVLHTSTCIGQPGKIIGDGLVLSSGSKILREHIKIGNNVSIAPMSLVLNSCLEDNVLLAGCPANIRKNIRPWYVGTKYEARVRQIEELKRQMNVSVQK